MFKLKNIIKPRLLVIIFFCFPTYAQVFERSELPTQLSVPWEITYGPDHFLWLTEQGGKVLRVDPNNGDKQLVYEADDFFKGSPSENMPVCHSKILTGTLGLALHPEFINPDSAYIYYLYSYNSGTEINPATKFKVKRLKWNTSLKEIVEAVDLITLIPTSYDHIGGRLLTIKENGKSYLFLSIGDHGKSEIDSPTCYPDQSKNPNNFTQDPSFMQGKIHRYNIDGTIPADNPVLGNSFYTRGHRNPQGLMYNPNRNTLYCVEHGERTDDEINILYKGMNYGWKDVRGYHNDNNHLGEQAYISNYTKHSEIKNDSLVEAFYAWCTSTADTSTNYADWCTVAPSDGMYYCHTAIPEWHNSLLVATLKDGVYSDRGVYQFKLSAKGKIMPSTPEAPNPKFFFGEDQPLNGRIRDITSSLDGKKIFLINNGGAPSNKITVYKVVVNENETDHCMQIMPNPANDFVTLHFYSESTWVDLVQILSAKGNVVWETNDSSCMINVTNLSAGVYIINVVTNNGVCTGKFLKI